MKKLLEIENSEEFRNTLIVQYIFNILTFFIFILARIHDQSLFEFDFFFEFLVLYFLLRFFRLSHKNKNFAFWGYSGVLFLYLLRHILHFTFVDQNILIIYMSFLAVIFMALNAYMMSSPLYYPRVQWWEYDFRYRGDLKIFIANDDKPLEARMVDLRRECISIMAFEKMSLGDSIRLEIPYGSNTYLVTGKLKTIREDISGRPISYGVRLKLDQPKDRKSYQELLRLWNMHQKVNIRRKFSEYKQS